MRRTKPINIGFHKKKITVPSLKSVFSLFNEYYILLYIEKNVDPEPWGTKIQISNEQQMSETETIWHSPEY